ncbi:MAG: hypothetical protein AB8B81_17990 [Halioglobus sp.]
MNRLQKVGMTLLAVSMSWSQNVLSQDEEAKATPAEFFSCKFMKGKSLKDVEKVAANFSKWSKENDGNYAAWLLTPQFHSGESSFDVGWLGAWTDGNAFGKGQDAWLNSGGKIAGDFAKVMDCSGRHEMSASVPINAPDTPPGDGVLMVSQCNVNEGKTVADSYEAHMKMGAAAKANGSKASSYLFYPLLGVGAEEFDYYFLVASENYTQLGAMIESYTNGGGYMRAQEILGPVETCTSPNVYDVRAVVIPG